MKILQVIPHYFPSVAFGGTPVSCHHLSTNLVELGHSVDVLTTDAFSTDQRTKITLPSEKYSNYNVYRFRNISNKLAYSNRFATPIPNLRFILQNIPKYDVVQLHEYRNLLNVMLCLLKPFLRSKYILYPLGTYPIYNTQNSFKKIFDLFFARIINISVDYVVAVSNAERLDLIKSGVEPKKIRTIYYGVDVIERKSLNKSPKPFPYILYIGRIDKRKGVDELISAYFKSKIYDKGVHLVIAGNDSNFLAECKNIVSKLKIDSFVHFDSPVGGIEKSTLYKFANLVVYVTKSEAYGLVPMEATLCGTQSIFDISSGVAEVLTKYNVGYGASYGDTKELGNLIKKHGLVKEPVKTAAIKQLLKKYSWLSVAADFAKLYEK